MSEVAECKYCLDEVDKKDLNRRGLCQPCAEDVAWQENRVERLIIHDKL